MALIEIIRNSDGKRLLVPECRFGDGHPAKARYATPRGCACFKGDREQDLCQQHIIKGGMIGDVELLKVYY